MRLGGLILLLVLSYFFNPVVPIVDEVVEISEVELTPIHDSDYLDASLVETFPKECIDA